MFLSKCLLGFAENLLCCVLWWSRSVKTWPPSSAPVSVCDSCCLSCCHWSQAVSCKPLISAVFPRLIIPSLCLHTHMQYTHLASTPKHLSISCQTHTHLGIFFIPVFYVHSWCWHCFLTHAPHTYKCTQMMGRQRRERERGGEEMEQLGKWGQESKRRRDESREQMQRWREGMGRF